MASQFRLQRHCLRFDFSCMCHYQCSAQLLPHPCWLHVSVSCFSLTSSLRARFSEGANKNSYVEVYGFLLQRDMPLNILITCLLVTPASHVTWVEANLRRSIEFYNNLLSCIKGSRFSWLEWRCGLFTAQKINWADDIRLLFQPMCGSQVDAGFSDRSIARSCLGLCGMMFMDYYG